MKLGNLSKVDIRDVWKDEARDFTPWLAGEENIRILSEEIGIELEVVSMEKDVGPYRVDILCRDVSTDNWVVIENQLEKTDHNHLGQILTYSAGLKALTMIWIARLFTEEHRAVIDWLNEITDESYNFFGIEIQAWQIGDSLPAPKFSLVCKPNNWVKSMGEKIQSETFTETQQFQLDYWTAFKKFMEESDSSILRIGKPQPQNWMSFSVGRSGIGFSAIVSSWDTVKSAYTTGEIRVELYISHRSKEENSNCLQKIKEQTTEELKELKEEIFWYDPDEAKVCKVYVRKSVDIKDRNTWESQFAWLKENLEMFYKVFMPLIREL